MRLVTRRQVLRLVPSAAGLALLPTGCKALLGEETIEAFVDIPYSTAGTFWGWTEYKLESPAEDGDGALLKRVLLRAPDGVPDLRFITSLLGEAVTPTERTPLVEGSDFPENDTMAPLDVIYDGDLRPFFADGQHIRIEWSGTIDTSYAFPVDPIHVVALIVVEVV